MVTLELQLQLPSAEKALPGSLQLVDPVAALQQLIQNQRVPRVSRSLAAARQEVEIDTTLQPLQVPPQLPKQHSSRQTTKPTTASPTTTPRSAQRKYANDGVRLSELGEQPLAVATESSHGPQQELSFSLLDPGNCGGSQSRHHGASVEQLHSKRKGYVCSTKDDPLVKGRLAS